jgi:glycosyltransferase involved in cell wall biosynthesis
MITGASRPSRPLGIVGSMCGLDVLLGDALVRAGASVRVLRPTGMEARTAADLADAEALTAGHVRIYRGTRSFLTTVRCCSFVFSYSAQLGYEAGRALRVWPLLQRLGWPAYMNIATGSDMTELARAQTPQAATHRRALRHAWMNMVLHYPEALRTVAHLRLRNACVLPPLQVPVAQAEPAPVGSGTCYRRHPDELVIFHASHLDWGREDATPGRNSTKGNDRFLRAAAEAIGTRGLRARLVILDRGPDAAHARALVRDLGLDEHTVWLPPLSRAELQAAIAEVDLVVDQFDVGALGMIAWEAMSAGRPVATYLNEATQRLVYEEPPPVLNARTVDDIALRLLAAGDRDWLRAQGERSRAWTQRHSPDRLVIRYLFYALTATGRAPVDLGWGNDERLATIRSGTPLA